MSKGIVRIIDRARIAVKLIGILVGLGAASVCAASGEPLQFVGQYGWGGQTLVCAHIVFCTADPRDGLPAFTSAPGQTALYGTLRLGPGGARRYYTAIVLRDHAGQTRLAIRSLQGQWVTDQAGVPLSAAAAPPFAPGRASAVVPFTIPAPDGTTVTRSFVFWTGDAPGALFYATSGFMQGTVSCGGVERQCFVVDGAGTGWLGDTRRDDLWIDLNGDGKLDPVTEEFPAGQPFRIGDATYRAVIAPDGRSIGIQQMASGVGKVCLALSSRPGTSFTSAHATLAGESGDLCTLEGSGAEVTAAAGRYRLPELSLQERAGKGAAYTYAFQSAGDDVENPVCPLQVVAGQTTPVAPLAGLRFSTRTEGLAALGGDLVVIPSLRTSSGLELESASSEGDPQGGRENWVKITLRDPQGAVVGDATSGFS